MTIVTIEEVAIRLDAQGRYCLNDLHKAAIANGKATESQRPERFMKTDKVQEFISALDASNTDAPKSASVHSVKGGLKQGTYAVELVAIRYAAWIDPAFEIRVYRTFQTVTKDKGDWRKLRHATASTTKMANDLLKLVRQADGKETESHHFSNEARLVNWALMGEFKGVDRDSLASDQLDKLAYLQERNAVLIGRGLSYDQRKPMVAQYAKDWCMKQLTSSATPAPAATKTVAKGD